MAEDGEDDLKNAAPDRQDAVLEASWRALGRDLGGLGAFLGSKVVSGGVNPGVQGAALQIKMAPARRSLRRRGV